MKNGYQDGYKDGYHTMIIIRKDLIRKIFIENLYAVI